MKALLCATLLALSTAAGSADREAEISYDQAWSRALSVVTSEGFEVKTSERESGLIQAARASEGRGEWFSCPRGEGAKWFRQMSLSVVINTTKTGVNIEIHANATETWYRNRHFLWLKTGKHENYVTCESTGVLERLLLQRIAPSIPI